MFCIPCRVDKTDAIFNLVWTYNVKELNGHKKARHTCNGPPRAGQARVLDYTYANFVDQTSSQMFYTLAAAKKLMLFGANTTDVFG